MKTKLLFLALFAIMMTTAVRAQDECTIAVSLFTEPAKIKNYEGALTHYEKAITQCPSYSVAVYQYAVKMFEYFIEQGDKTKIKDSRSNEWYVRKCDKCAHIFDPRCNIL